MSRAYNICATVAVLMAATFLCACAGGGATGMSLRMLAEQSDIPEETLKSGRAYHLRECSACHQLVQPDERQPAEWERILAGKKNKVSLTPEQFEKLKRYIMASSEAAAAKVGR